MSAPPKPTPAQERLIRYFAGEATADRQRPPAGPTYAACERNGWIEKTDEWPYHRTTDAGRDAIGAPR
jgi:hypothetical protein